MLWMLLRIITAGLGFGTTNSADVESETEAGTPHFPSRWHALRLPAVGTLKRYSKALEYEYRVKTTALDTLKRYSILSLTLYLE
jgi:hypothetical protein